MSSETKPIMIRLSIRQLGTLKALVKSGIFRSRTRAIETLIDEGLEKRGLINYEEVETD